MLKIGRRECGQSSVVVSPQYIVVVFQLGVVGREEGWL